MIKKKRAAIQGTHLHNWLKREQGLSKMDQLIVAALFCNPSVTLEKDSERVVSYLKRIAKKLSKRGFYSSIWRKQWKYLKKCGKLGDIPQAEENCREWVRSNFFTHLSNKHRYHKGTPLIGCSTPHPHFSDPEIEWCIATKQPVKFGCRRAAT